MKWRQLSEAQIAKAKAEGQFDNLEGAGKPLENSTQSGEALGYRIMKDAGVVPREFTLRKELDTLRAQLSQAQEANAPAQDITALKHQIFKTMDALSKEEEARRAFMRD